MTQRILVTGGAGFVGANLVRTLVGNGHRVRVIDNLTSGTAEHLEGVDVELIKGDIRDAGDLASAMRDIDKVVHLAAAGSVIMSIEDPASNFEINALGTFRVLNAAREAGVERVVLASTGGALMGDTPPPVNEKSLPKPIAPYGASKLAGEGYAHAFSVSYGLRTICLRFANVYGPYMDQKSGVINKFFTGVRSGEPLQIFGDQSRDYIYVEDLCGALQQALSADLPGGTVLHIASGVETRTIEVADIIRRIAGKPDHPIEHQPKRRGEVDRNFASYELAHELLGFTPKVQREEGMRRTWEWFAQHVF